TKQTAYLAAGRADQQRHRAGLLPAAGAVSTLVSKLQTGKSDGARLGTARQCWPTDIHGGGLPGRVEVVRYTGDGVLDGSFGIGGRAATAASTAGGSRGWKPVVAGESHAQACDVASGTAVLFGTPVSVEPCIS